MATTAFKGTAVHTNGELPSIGTKAPDFHLIANDLSEHTLANYAGKRLILSIFPSIDTGVCATSVRQFNALAANIEGTAVLCVSRDLPFAQKRFCGAENIENVHTLSDFATGAFGKNYGVELQGSPLKYLHARAIIVLNEAHEVVYTELVSEITQEPNYDAALAALK